MELLLRALNFKSRFSTAPAGIASMLVVVSALSACNTSKMIGDVTPGETLNQGYIMDQQAIDSGHPDYAPMAANNLGVLLADQGDIEGAKAAYQQAIDSGHPDAALRATSNLTALLGNVP